jgi:type I restriction enzyme S subunit
MTDTAKRYPAYRDSGIEWLGEIPRHWDVLPARAVYTPKETKNLGMSRNTVLSLSFGRIVVRPADKLHGLVPQSFETYQHVDPGDIIVRTTDLQNDQRSLRVGIARDGGIITSAYLCLATTDRASPSFGYQLLNTYDLLKIIYGYGSGLRQSLDFADLKHMPVPVPPLPEQETIVSFLDHADRRIRRYITAKQKLIALLGEQKRAIIHRAVTRGLDPDVPLKPSGVEWLGDVPAHWELSRVKAEFLCLDRRRVPLSGVERGTMKARRYDYYGASGVIDKVDHYLFDDDLLLIAEDGANLVLRSLPLAVIARGRFWVNNHAHVLKPRRGNLGYLGALMEGLNYLPWISGAAQPKLTQDRLMSIAIAVPPRWEQDEIMASVASEIGTIQEGIDRAVREVSLLREYRTRLIADVVTGRLDVREASTRLPDEAEEREALAFGDAVEAGVLLDDDSEIDELAVESEA